MCRDLGFGVDLRGKTDNDRCRTVFVSLVVLNDQYRSYTRLFWSDRKTKICQIKISAFYFVCHKIVLSVCKKPGRGLPACQKYSSYFLFNPVTPERWDPIRRTAAKRSSREFHPCAVARAIAVQAYHYPFMTSSLMFARHFY